MKRGEFWTAAGVIVALLLGIMYMMDSNETELRTEIQELRNDVREDLSGMDDNISRLRTDVRDDFGKMDDNINRLRTEVREDFGKMDDNINGLRTDVREDLRDMDDNIGGLRTEVTKIAEDVGYLRGRQDERDQGTADQ